MSQSFQHEIPAARVNITLDVMTNGAKQKKELPLKLLCIGDFSNGGNTQSVAKTKRFAVQSSSLNDVMRELHPELTLSVKNTLTKDTEPLTTTLGFQSLSDFAPEAIVRQIPALSQLVAMRNLLKDLKANLIDNKSLQRAILTLLQSPHAANQLKQELAHTAPLQGVGGHDVTRS